MTMRLASTAATTAAAVLASSSVCSAAAASAKNQHTVRSGSITSNSVVGQRILAAATREDAPLNGGRALDDAQNADQNGNVAYLTNYSLKFQGCHEITQWNGEADGEDDVRVSTKRLVRFRLCPSGSCQDESSAGCTSGYGDYVMDMNTFLEAYLQGVEEEKEYQCQIYMEKCDNQCGNMDDDACDQACLTGYGMSECYEGEDGAFDLQEYVQCAEWAGNDGGNDNGNAYYVGPYCSDQGGSIHLGLFTDETCTTFSSSDFYTMAGYELPYSDQNLVQTDCMSCYENADDNNDNDADNVAEMCETMYQMSGKCETNMNNGYSSNEAACTYIEGIKIIREGGVIRTSTTEKSKAAAIVIGLFSTVAVLLGAYVYYLRTKLGRAKINLGSGGGAYA